MVVKRWILKGGVFRRNDEICELETDGVASIFAATQIDPADAGGVRWHYVAEGNEISPACWLLEYSDIPIDAQGSGPFSLHPGAVRPLVRRQDHQRFFLSYRREDTEPYAWRLHESMASAWGDGDVFMDQYSIQPGESFPWAIQQAAVHAKAMLVLIGPKWLSLTDKSGRRRIDSEDDFLRREVVAALDRGTLVVPILVGGATLPDQYSLPNDLGPLMDVQFYELHHRHWRDDVGRLKTYLEKYFHDVLKDPMD